MSLATSSQPSYTGLAAPLRTLPASTSGPVPVARPGSGGECPSARSHFDLHGVPVSVGCSVSVAGSRPVKVVSLYGAGQFVFMRRGVEVSQFCCVAEVV